MALGVPDGALVLMGHPYAFEEIVIVDLPRRTATVHQDRQTQTTSLSPEAVFILLSLDD